MSDQIKTRFWDGELTSTAVQFRTDAEPMVWVHSNIGWHGISNTPNTIDEAEKFAEDIAKSYGLEEASERRARYMLGLDEGLDE